MTDLGKITAAECGAFVQLLKIEPSSSGPLDGLRFGVQDLIDIGGCVTGCGNPDWAKTHLPAAVNAVCVDQLLAAGATCVGKTICDELGFSLTGENFFYGTPLNPQTPDRVPGGSSSGSASVVACGLADFALGTDTAGSVLVPASNCGLYGLRPSHGLISVAGVLSLAPSFDTVGILASDVELLARGTALLLSYQVPTSPQLGTIHVIQETLDLCELEVRQALAHPFWILRELFRDKVKETSLRHIDGESRNVGLTTWFDTLCTIQWAEIRNSLGTWVEAVQPVLGPKMKNNLELTRTLDRREIGAASRLRENYCRRLDSLLGTQDLLCLPTTPALAPIKGTLGDEARGYQSQGSYFYRSLSLMAIAGIGRLPQLTLPLGNVGGVPIGLSLLAGYKQDAFLLAVASQVAGGVL